MKKIFVIICLMTFSKSALALSDQQLATHCLEKGKSKILQQAQAWGCDVNLEETEVRGVDNRWYNPSKYIWYQAASECNGQDQVLILVQYYRGQCL